MAYGRPARLSVRKGPRKWSKTSSTERNRPLAICARMIRSCSGVSVIVMRGRFEQNLYLPERVGEDDVKTTDWLRYFSFAPVNARIGGWLANLN